MAGKGTLGYPLWDTATRSFERRLKLETIYCRVPIVLLPCLSVGCWERIKEPSDQAISTTTWMNIRSASIDAPQVHVVSYFSVWWSKRSDWLLCLAENWSAAADYIWYRGVKCIALNSEE